MTKEEAIKIVGMVITRVPGGWIFETPNQDGNGWNPVFVPFDNEFMNYNPTTPQG